jgi:uncharacterized protein YbjT (DUF2867 family)
MHSVPVIAVIGATGAEGGGLIRAIRAEPARKFVARAVTPDPSSPWLAELGAQGVEIHFGNLDEPATLERAFKGAHGVYGVTNYWQHRSPEREVAQAYNIATAARRAGVRHIVWSTLEDTRVHVPLKDDRLPTLLGRYKVPQMDAKGESDSFFRDLPTTYLRTSFHWNNLTRLWMAPRRGDDGGLSLVLPMGDRKLPGIVASDIGACALEIFKRGAEFVGRTMGIAGEHLTGQEMAQALSHALGEPVRHVSMSSAEYAQLAFEGAREPANMFQYQHDFSLELCSQRSVEFSRALYPRLRSLRGWLEMNAARIPREPLNDSVSTFQQQPSIGRSVHEAQVLRSINFDCLPGRDNCQYRG